MKHIRYEKLETQPYLKSHLFSNEENHLLFALRSRTARIFRANFSNLYGGKVECPLQCWDQALYEPAIEDSQEHILFCKKLRVDSSLISCGKVVYSDLFADVYKQKEAVTLYTLLMEEREKQINERDSNPPGDNLDLSTGRHWCCSDALFTGQTTCNNNRE